MQFLLVLQTYTHRSKTCNGASSLNLQVSLNTVLLSPSNLSRKSDTRVAAVITTGNSRPSALPFGPLRQHLGHHRFHKCGKGEMAAHGQLHMKQHNFYCNGIFKLGQDRKNESMCFIITLKKITFQ
jgi:hypothetical protein